jgi:uncharacterized protein
MSGRCGRHDKCTWVIVRSREFRRRLATQSSENTAARLTGREAVTFEGKPTAFAQCFKRIETVQKMLDESDKDVVKQHANVLSPTPKGPEKTVGMAAATYAHVIAIPNIYFHLITAHGILRKEGVSPGKLDY